jgi:membrane protein implicated in regulation of membrane protease activity
MNAVLDLGIDLDAWPWIWLGVAVVFALVELTALAGSFVLLPFAVSAFGASLAGFYNASVEVQWSIFIFAGAALWVLFWKYSKRFIHDNAMPAGVGADRLVGMTAIVTSAIDPDDINRTGRVKIVGEDWGALTEESRVIPAGSKVTIRSMNGTRVMVDAFVLPVLTEPPTAPPSSSPSASPPTSEES